MLTVRGWAFDPDHARKSVHVRLHSVHHPLTVARAGRASHWYDHTRGIHGKHRFVIHVKVRHDISKVRVLSAGTSRGRAVRLDAHRVKQVHPRPARRIVDVARRYVGKVPYRWGGSTPRQGFDCSGYSRWVYAHAHVLHMPHSAQAQRGLNALHTISRRHARPGDLIFYLNNSGYAYHVAIKGRGDSEYAATQPGQKIKHQGIWGRNLVFKTYR